MSFENFNNNVIKSASSASSGAKKKDEETKAPSGGIFKLQEIKQWGWRLSQ